MIRVIVQHVIFDLGHVREPKFTVWALVNDTSRLHKATLVLAPQLRKGPSAPPRRYVDRLSVKGQNRVRASSDGSGEEQFRRAPGPSLGFVLGRFIDEVSGLVDGRQPNPSAPGIHHPVILVIPVVDIVIVFVSSLGYCTGNKFDLLLTMDRSVMSVALVHVAPRFRWCQPFVHFYPVLHSYVHLLC